MKKRIGIRNGQVTGMTLAMAIDKVSAIVAGVQDREGKRRVLNAAWALFDLDIRRKKTP